MATRVVNFPSSANQSQSQIVTLANLTSIVSVKVNTGNVSYTVSGDKITINVSNGAYVSRESYIDPHYYSKYVSGQTSSSYSDSDGYSGSLDSYVYQSSDSRPEYDTRTSTTTINLRCNIPRYELVSSSSTTAPDSISYNSGGYSGTLTRTGHVDTQNPPITAGSSCDAQGRTTTQYIYNTVYYSGTVTKPAVYRYQGWAYKSGTAYRNYRYAYDVTIEYIDRVKMGVQKIRLTSTSLESPIYDPNVGMAGKNQARVRLSGNRTGCYELVETSDPRASGLRVRTATGTKSVAKT